jgi:hypothetical protein
MAVQDRAISVFSGIHFKEGGTLKEAAFLLHSIKGFLGIHGE